jgi:hypothetical protein
MGVEKEEKKILKIFSLLPRLQINLTGSRVLFYGNGFYCPDEWPGGTLSIVV